jgi:hypothetical protein
VNVFEGFERIHQMEIMEINETIPVRKEFSAGKIVRLFHSMNAAIVI